MRTFIFLLLFVQGQLLAGVNDVITINPNSASTIGGTIIVVSGISNPASVTQILVGDKACGFIILQGNDFQCLVPDGIGKQPVYVISDSQQDLSGSSHFLFYDAPSVQQVSPTDLNQVGGQTITIQGTNFGGETPVVLIGGKPCQVTNSNHNQIDCISPSGRGSNHGLVVMQTVDNSTTVPNVFSYISCPVGTYTQNGQCLPCDPGTYQDQTDANQCKLCPAGQYTNISGAASCNNCNPGTFADSVGSSSCSLCLAGSFQDQSGQSSCKLCEPGTANNSEGAFSCSACPAGRFAVSSGQQFCEVCNAGTFQSQQGQTSCITCAPGTVAAVTGMSSCTACSPGKYQNQAGQASCMNCDPGTFTNFSGSAQCSLCPCGTFQNVSGSTNCLTCPDSELQPAEGQTSCLGPGQCDALYGIFYSQFKQGLESVPDPN